MAATNMIMNASYALETAEYNKAKETLLKTAEKMGLKPQKDFYINKFKEYLDKNPEASVIYPKLNSERKTKYVEMCYEEFGWKVHTEGSKGIKGITSNKMFENMTKNPKTFTEIDTSYEHQYGTNNVEDLESSEEEEEYERD